MESANIGDISAVIKEARASIPQVGAKVFPEPLSFEELIAMDVPPTQWLYEKLLPLNGLIAISGKPGSYKTFFAIWIALRLSQGLRLFDNFTDTNGMGEQGVPGTIPVLFIEEENTLQLIKERVTGFKRERIPDMHFAIENGIKITDDDSRSFILERIKKLGIKLVILDPFSSVMGLENENDNAEVSKSMDILRHEFVKQGVSVLFIHHPSKGDGGGKTLRGAGDILGKCDVHISLEKDPDDLKLINVSYEKMRVMDQTLLSDYQIKLTEDPATGKTSFTYEGSKTAKFLAERDLLKEEILKAFKSGGEMSRKDLAEICGESSSGDKFSNAWNYLRDKGEIVEVNRYKFKLKDDEIPF